MAINPAERANRTAVLVIRVWVEEADAGPTLRVRLTSRSDVTREEQQTHIASSADEALEQTARWLRQFERDAGLDVASL